MQIVSLEAKAREGNRKKGAKAVRNAGLIPAVLYGGDENIHFSVTKKGIKSLVYTSEFKLAKIDLNGATYDSIVKDIQFHPVSDEVLHVDFLRLIEGNPIKVDIPIRFEGVSPGEKEGGKLTQALRKVQIKTTPEHLVDNIKVDITKVLLGQTIRIRDLILEEEMEVMNPMGAPIASMIVPRVMKGMDLDLEEEEVEGELIEGEEGAEGTEGAEGAEGKEEGKDPSEYNKS